MGEQRLSPSQTAYLGLGSNLGDRRAHLSRAVSTLEATPGVRVLARSSVYRTSPVGPVAQPDFANQVVELETGLEPRALLRLAWHLEALGGRLRARPQGPRTLDVDLLLYGDRVISEEGLVVPHPRLAERRFVLVPLAEIAPQGRHPLLGRTFASLCASLRSDHGVQLWSP